jgi:hypothetical protein
MVSHIEVLYGGCNGCICQVKSGPLRKRCKMRGKIEMGEKRKGAERKGSGKAIGSKK